MPSRWRIPLSSTAILSLALAQNPTVRPEQVFSDRCALCHGGDASGTDRGPALARSGRLRNRSAADIREIIRQGTAGGMPPFSLPDRDLQGLAEFVKSLNANAIDAQPQGDIAAGERFFFGQGQCGSCHLAGGRGKSVGPDLSNVGRRLTPGDLTRKWTDGKAPLSAGYETVTVRLRDGSTVRGFARRETLHSLQLQTAEGRLLLLAEGEYQVVARETTSSRHVLKATTEEERDLLAFVSRLGGSLSLATPAPVDPAYPAAVQAVLNPRPGEWPTYNGNVSGNRHSPLDQINQGNVARLAAQWVYTIPYFGLEATPIVSDGVMYVSGPNQVHALDARSGQEIWRYSRPRSNNPNVAGDATGGANRGAALLGDGIFVTTDDAHLLCLDRLTGALRWDVYMPVDPQHYGGTVAPLVAGDLVIAGVAGADQGIRGFVAAYHAATGQLAWRFWTVPRAGEPGWETWRGNAAEFGGGSTWLTGSYDPETRVLYWPTGNPYPDTDGSDRQGDNLYTDCILALDLETGKLRWHFQFTPHDLHDWDAVQPPVLVDAVFHGRPRKLLLHADRNGFFYVLDRTNGEVLLAKAFASKITWASGIDEKGRPIELPGNIPAPEGTPTCPDIRGAANWMSTAFNPATGLYYVMTIENCGIYRSTDFGGRPAAGPGGFDRGGGFFSVPGHEPPRRYLRALDIQSGKVVWETEQKTPAPNYGGALSTAGGLVFYSESSGAFAAVDAASGRTLWHFETGQPPKASPMTYMVNGRQYVAIAAGSNILAFALPQ